MALDGAVKIVVKIAIGIEMEKVTEKDRVFAVNLFPVFGVKIERRFLVVGVVSFTVMFFDFDFVDVAIIDIRQKTAKQKFFPFATGKFKLVS